MVLLLFELQYLISFLAVHLLVLAYLFVQLFIFCLWLMHMHVL